MAGNSCLTESEQEALERGAHRRLAPRLPGGELDLDKVDDRDLSQMLPESKRRAYDVHPLVAALLDDGTMQERHERWAPNIVTALGRLGGRTVGVVANNPLRLGGCLDSLSAEKASRFVPPVRRARRTPRRPRRRARLPPRASARSGTASYAAARSCSTLSASVWSRGSRW